MNLGQVGSENTTTLNSHEFNEKSNVDLKKMLEMSKKALARNHI